MHFIIYSHFLLKCFTNQLLLWFLYLQVIINYSNSAKPAISCLFFLLVKQTQAGAAILESHKRRSTQMFSFLLINLLIKIQVHQFLSKITVPVSKQIPWENNYVILIVRRLLSGSTAIQLLTNTRKLMPSFANLNCSGIVSVAVRWTKMCILTN